MNNVVRTPLEELNLTDRFLFAETMDEPEAYEAAVGILLEDEIKLLDYPQTEKELRISPELRAVRLDVINMDESGQIYFTEMQKHPGETGSRQGGEDPPFREMWGEVYAEMGRNCVCTAGRV